MMYEEFTTEFGVKLIKRINDDGTFSFIPMDEANADYQAYLNPETALSTPIVSDAD